MKYNRPPNAVKDDFFRSREFETLVGDWLGEFKFTNLTSNDKLDYYLPSVAVDVKERKAPLSNKWPLPKGCTPEDAFVLDEVAIRKGLEHFPGCYFLLRDTAGDRTFLARIDELLLCDRVRVNREYNGTSRGKVVVCMTDFKQLLDPKTELLPAILADLVALNWRQAPCLFPTDEET